MKLEDQFKLLVGGYYGVRSLDDYDLKVYVLKDIENYISNFIEINPISHYDYRGEAERFDDELSLKTKLQDALLVLHKIDAPMEVVLLVKKQLKHLEEVEKRGE